MQAARLYRSRDMQGTLTMLIAREGLEQLESSVIKEAEN